MRTIREITNNPARDIVEGRFKPRTVQTVPLREFTVAPASASVATANELPPLTPVSPLRNYPRGGLSITDALDLFRQSNPGEFMVHEAAAFITAAGWRGGADAERSLCQKLRRMYFADQVEEVRKAGNGIVWKFTEQRDAAPESNHQPIN